MIFATVLLLLYMLPDMQSVKIVIDGTIDFGPKWNFNYKINPSSDNEHRKRQSNNPGTTLHREIIDTKSSKEIKDTSESVTTELISDSNDSETRDRAKSEETDESSDNDSVEERDTGVTTLYKPNEDAKTKPILRKPRKIKDDAKVINFIQRMNNKSLNMFDNLQNIFNDKITIDKCSQLRDRYKNEFGKFINSTLHHTIRTTFGNKKIILNSINQSNKVLNRLTNRFKVDLEDHKHSNKWTKTFKEHVYNLKLSAEEDACRIFSICRTGIEFTDHINEMITNLLEHDDVKIQSVVKALIKSLKNADLNKLMDLETQKKFKNSLESLEELNPFELRVVLMAYKIIIENRNKPFENTNNDGHLIDVVVAMYDVLEGLNKNIIIGADNWKKIKKDFKKWLTNDEGDITRIIKELVDRFTEKLKYVDYNTAREFRSKLKLCLLGKQLSN